MLWNPRRLIATIKVIFFWSIDALLDTWRLGKYLLYEKPAGWLTGNWEVVPRDRLNTAERIDAEYHNQVLEIRDRLLSTTSRRDSMAPEVLLNAATTQTTNSIKEKLSEFSELPPWGRAEAFVKVHGEYQDAFELGLKSYTLENVAAFKKQHAKAQLAEFEFKTNVSPYERVSASLQNVFVKSWVSVKVGRFWNGVMVATNTHKGGNVRKFFTFKRAPVMMPVPENPSFELDPLF